MKIFHLQKKRSGGTRTIYAPSHEERAEYRTLLSQIAQPHAALKSAHGFMPGRNIVTNATPHVGKAMTISMDLSDFFDSVHPAMVRGRVPSAVLGKCFLRADGTQGTDSDCRARQGLPTSPALSNLAAAPMDEAIRKRLAKLAIPGAAYTRYADDLSISCDVDDQETARKIVSEVTQIASRNGFRVNPRKTRIQRASSGYREVCGVMATSSGVKISRRMRRLLRAARHNLAVAQANGTTGKTLLALERRARGYREFAALREPRIISETERTEFARLEDAKKIASNYGLKAPQPCRKILADQKIGENMYITTDPAMMYGMSAYTTGWTSCMAIVGRHNYSYHKGVPLWQRLSGVSLAYIDSGHTMTIAGVTRPKMSARCLVYALRDGRRCYGDVYSGEGHRVYRSHPLCQALEAQGFVAAPDCPRALVEGNVKHPCPLPYFDNANVETITLAESKSRAYRVRMK